MQGGNRRRSSVSGSSTSSAPLPKQLHMRVPVPSKTNSKAHPQYRPKLPPKLIEEELDHEQEVLMKLQERKRFFNENPQDWSTEYRNNFHNPTSVHTLGERMWSGSTPTTTPDALPKAPKRKYRRPKTEIPLPKDHVYGKPTTRPAHKKDVQIVSVQAMQLERAAIPSEDLKPEVKKLVSKVPVWAAVDLTAADVVEVPRMPPPFATWEGDDSDEESASSPEPSNVGEDTEFAHLLPVPSSPTSITATGTRAEDFQADPPIGARPASRPRVRIAAQHKPKTQSRYGALKKPRASNLKKTTGKIPDKTDSVIVQGRDEVKASRVPPSRRKSGPPPPTQPAHHRTVSTVSLFNASTRATGRPDKDQESTKDPNTANASVRAVAPSSGTLQLPSVPEGPPPPEPSEELGQIDQDDQTSGSNPTSPPGNNGVEGGGLHARLGSKIPLDQVSNISTAGSGGDGDSHMEQRQHREGNDTVPGSPVMMTSKHPGLDEEDDGPVTTTPGDHPVAPVASDTNALAAIDEDTAEQLAPGRATEDATKEDAKSGSDQGLRFSSLEAVLEAPVDDLADAVPVIPNSHRILRSPTAVAPQRATSPTEAQIMGPDYGSHDGVTKVTIDPGTPEQPRSRSRAAVSAPSPTPDMLVVSPTGTGATSHALEVPAGGHGPAHTYFGGVSTRTPIAKARQSSMKNKRVASSAESATAASTRTEGRSTLAAAATASIRTTGRSEIVAAGAASTRAVRRRSSSQDPRSKTPLPANLSTRASAGAPSARRRPATAPSSTRARATQRTASTVTATGTSKRLSQSTSSRPRSAAASASAATKKRVQDGAPVVMYRAPPGARTTWPKKEGVDAARLAQPARPPFHNYGWANKGTTAETYMRTFNVGVGNPDLIEPATIWRLKHALDHPDVALLPAHVRMALVQALAAGQPHQAMNALEEASANGLLDPAILEGDTKLSRKPSSSGLSGASTRTLSDRGNARLVQGNQGAPDDVLGQIANLASTANMLSMRLHESGTAEEMELLGMADALAEKAGALAEAMEAGNVSMEQASTMRQPLRPPSQDNSFRRKPTNIMVSTPQALPASYDGGPRGAYPQVMTPGMGGHPNQLPETPIALPRGEVRSPSVR